MALVVSTWIWGKKYGGHYIARLQYGVRKNLRQDHRFLVVNPSPGDERLYAGCFCRLRMFSPAFQREHGINPGDRLVCLDLDNVITGPLDPVFERDESFVILGGANAANPCPFNGSVMMLRAGEHADVWSEFSLEAAHRIPFYEFPDDQGWIHHRLPGAATWQAGRSSGIYGFHKPGWPKGTDKLPEGARMVCFIGGRDPSQFRHLSWIAE